MSKAKKMTPAEVASQIGQFIAKQEETLQRYPIGPLANAARANLKKGQAALAALQGQNEQMRVAKEQPQQMAQQGMQPPVPQGKYGGSVKKMVRGGKTGTPKFERGLRNLNPGNLRSWGNRPVVDGFATFSTLEDGWAALLQQLEVYKGNGSKPSQSGVTGTSTLAEAMSKYAPKFENNTSGYIDRLVQYLNDGGYNVTADTSISDIDTTAWASAISRVESPEAYAALTQQNIIPQNMVQAIPTVSDAESQNATTFLESITPAVDTATADAVPATVTAEPANPEEEAAAAELARTQSVLAAANSNVPETALMRAPGFNRGYLGGTYGLDATRVETPMAPIDQSGMEQFNATLANMPEDERRQLENRAIVDSMLDDFTYEEVAEWGKNTYGVSQGKDRAENVDSQIIGFNSYNADGTHRFMESDTALTERGGTGATVAETAVILQGLVDSGLDRATAFKALENPRFYQDIKANAIPSSIYFGRHNSNMLQGTRQGVSEYMADEGNRNRLLYDSTLGLQSTSPTSEGYLSKTAPAVQRGLTFPEAWQEIDKAAFYEANPGFFDYYALNRDSWARDPRSVPRGLYDTDINLTMTENRWENPNDMRMEPAYVGDYAPSPLDIVDPVPLPNPKQGTPVTGGGGKDGGDNIKKDNDPVETPEQRSETPISDIQPGAPDAININMPKNTWLQAVPALASLASVGIQKRALDRMQGPRSPIISDIPAFNYNSQIGQQLQDIRQATTAMGQNTAMSSGQQGAMRQGLLAQRMRGEAQVRAQDAQMRQAAKADYDRLSYAARQMNDTIRNKFQEDKVNYNNDMQDLRSQVKQQPLNVLSQTTQDYLKNVYAPNLATMLEGIGRQYNTELTQD